MQLKSATSRLHSGVEEVAYLYTSPTLTALLASVIADPSQSSCYILTIHIPSTSTYCC